MKTFTVSELAEFIENASAWEISQDETHDVVFDYYAGDYDDERSTIHGSAWTRCEREGVTLCYNESFTATPYDSDSLNASSQDVNEVWMIEGAEIVDDHGEALDYFERYRVLCELDYEGVIPESFKRLDYSFLNLDEIEDIDNDNDGESEMDKITIDNDNAPNLRFSGELIASESSKTYSSNRWTELNVWKTKGGRYVCQQIGHTQWANETTRYSAKVCEDLEEVIEFFGHGRLAKDLYFSAGIDAVEEIE